MDASHAEGGDRALAEADAAAIRTARAIPAHVVQAKGNGHAGTAMALAPLAHVLFQRVMRHDPGDPGWLGRDRLVLSAGHASLLLYVQYFLTGYGLELDEIAASRRLHSRTPGHPELHVTPGVEMSTGPLGQGFASAVGMAAAASHERAIFGLDDPAFARTTWVIVGDGCLQEGVSAEAASLAGTLGLGNLVALWDDNRITIDGELPESATEDTRARFRAYGWTVLDADGDDAAGIEVALTRARSIDDAPVIVAIRTTIGAPAPNRAGTPAAHAGGFGDDEVAEVKRRLGFAPDASLDDLVTAETLAHTRRAVDRGRGLHRAWDETVAAWSAAHPARAEAWRSFRAGDADAALTALDELGELAVDASVATRVANGEVVRALAAAAPASGFWSGSADLSGSTNLTVPGERFTWSNPGGEFVRFGIREHAMAAFLTGVALDGPWRPAASTYLAFSDYQRPAMRLQALMRVPVVNVYTHDSLAVGEDGPTHQPVEQLAALRTIPGLDVVRPADAHEVRAAWRRILAEPRGPVALACSRQNLPVLDGVDIDGVCRGGYVLARFGGAASSGEGSDAEAPRIVLIATGSEVSLALEAARRLSEGGTTVRVVSMPCVEWFLDEAAAYRASVLPPGVRTVAVEAGRGDAWYRFADAVVSVEGFGESGSGPEVMERAGMTVEAIVEAANAAT